MQNHTLRFSLPWLNLGSVKFSCKILNITYCCHFFLTTERDRLFLLCCFPLTFSNYNVLWTALSLFSLTIILFIKIHHAKNLHVGSADHVPLPAVTHTLMALDASCPKISSVYFIQRSATHFCFPGSRCLLKCSLDY